MPNLHHLELELSGLKQKAIEDARKAQAAILRECADAGRDPPPYLLSELIGKGSFGRVYKAADTRAKPARLVAVKIISIEEGDTLSPGAADTFNDILREVNTLKLLSSTGAKNVNSVLDSVLVGQSVWIITEHCAGGSVASLMRPTGGLPEKWIIPILREVAEAIFWVHRQGVIHRDIKCANVLVTDSGGVQLCDFGVAGIMETRFDKRSTVTGTLQWMAPELFDSPKDVSYGMEVDIWAFGSMAYEVASGLPPNATANIDLSQFGAYLKQYCPRLEGDKYSDGLKALVAFCMVDDPAKRPRIEQVQQHHYIFNTEDEYPTASLSKLVSAYKLWEAQGGIRRSLFCAGGAQGSANMDDESQSPSDEWNFGDNDDDDGFLENSADALAVYDAYDVPFAAPTETPQTQSRQGRRRRPPKNMPQLRGPLEKVFDPNTLSNYGDNARAFYGYGRQDSSPPPDSDLPLRNLSQDSTVRESLIDLDASLGGDTLTRFGDAETIKPAGRQVAAAADSGSTDMGRRKTQDWTFPAMTPAIEGPDEEPFHFLNEPSSAINTRPTRAFHSADNSYSDYRISLTVPVSQPNRGSTLSLIDLDASILDDIDTPLSAFPSPPQRPPHALTIDTVSFSNPHSASSTADSYSYIPSNANTNANRESNLSLIDLDASYFEETPRPSTADSYSYIPSNNTTNTNVNVNANRESNLSLIDLDASYIDPPTDFITRPSTAGSQTTSPGSVNESAPFDLEFEVQSLPPTYTYKYREPSMYVAADPSDPDHDPVPDHEANRYGDYPGGGNGNGSGDGDGDGDGDTSSPDNDNYNYNVNFPRNNGDTRTPTPTSTSTSTSTPSPKSSPAPASLSLTRGTGVSASTGPISRPYRSITPRLHIPSPSPSTSTPTSTSTSNSTSSARSTPSTSMSYTLQRTRPGGGISTPTSHPHPHPYAYPPRPHPHPHPRPALSFSTPPASLNLNGIALVPPLPPLPSPPSANALQGLGSREGLKEELQNMIMSLNEHLQHTAECLAALPVRRVEKGERLSQVQAQARWGDGMLGEVV